MLKLLDVGFCESCIYGKQKWVMFLSTLRSLKNKKLEMAHNDEWEPTHMTSNGIMLYLVMFIDESTLNIWDYFLKSKSSVFDAFKMGEVKGKNETRVCVKCLHHNNCGE